jgi:hypothetical protein
MNRFTMIVHEEFEETADITKIYTILLEPIRRTSDETTTQLNDTFYKELVTLERSYVTIECIPLITDIQMRNETLQDLIKNNFSENPHSAVSRVKFGDFLRERTQQSQEVATEKVAG